jgi:hypothetical protein
LWLLIAVIIDLPDWAARIANRGAEFAQPAGIRGRP